MSVLRLNGGKTGWRGVCLIAITYVYFLIFAQFAFLNRLGQLGIADAHLQIVMAAMAVGGIVFSLLASLKSFETWSRMRLQLSLVLCGVAAVCTLLPLNLPASIVIALMIGAGLGLLTVTLVSNLRLWIGSSGAVFKVGIGTGIGYFLCNVPALFTASPKTQAMTAACLCGIGVLVAWKTDSMGDKVTEVPSVSQIPFAAVLIAFTALVWLDSAAFFIIQNTPSLKAGTWEGTVHLWANGCIHLAAALLSGFLLQRRSPRDMLALAVLALATACLLLHQPGQVWLASLFYPVGVSFYSVALVAYPCLLAVSRSPHQQATRAALLYSIAGWIGSAMGIGMAQHLRQVPVPFVVFAGLLVLAPTIFDVVRNAPRETGLVAAALALALCIRLAVAASALPAAFATETASERGRRVYVAEGCIHCHPQYVRPNTSDVLLWGPTETVEELRSQHPPLIGNRRQGPDLSQVGGRRSPLWLKVHFFNPAQVSHASFMPSYAHLFEGSTRGDDLVAYLVSLKSPAYAQHVAMEQGWLPSERSVETADARAGARLYEQDCATCHEAAGATRRACAHGFKRLPPDLKAGPWMHVPISDASEERMLALARIIKFGILGTDMPGHESLADGDVVSLALWVNRTMAVPQQFASTQQYQSGENR